MFFLFFFVDYSQGHFYKRALLWLVYIIPEDFSIRKFYLPDGQEREA
jgi:hypothetical protein